MGCVLCAGLGVGKRGRDGMGLVGRMEGDGRGRHVLGGSGCGKEEVKGWVRGG